tara:strand:+ start:323 stop:508 length:186 start_codon:yes stop_codon:yes gene_type:complete
MKRRIYKNYVTTILGILILAFCALMMYQEKQTAGELSGWLTVGLLFLRSKDSLINLPKRRL